MVVKQLLSAKRADLIYVAPAVSVGAAIRLMQREQVGAVLVLDENDRLLGLVSERDVVHALALDAENLLERAVIDITPRDTPVAAPQDSVQSVMATMTASRSRHVVVVQFGRVVGVVSIGDVVKSRLDEKTQENAVLQEIARAQFFAS